MKLRPARALSLRYDDASATFAIGSNATGAPRTTVDRALALPDGAPVPWRVLLRAAWTGPTMSEFYVDDVWVLSYTLPSGALPGDGALDVAPLGEATLAEAYTLTLPNQR